MTWTNSCAGLCAAVFALGLFGCAHVENHWREGGTSRMTDWRTPTEIDIRENHQASEPRARGWDASPVAVVDGTVTHWPLYMEDPFVDKGSGNNPFEPFETGVNEYRVGWEDLLAIPYGHARYTLNYLLMPFSAIVTPPWTMMESDGFISRQLAGHDHDATPQQERTEPQMNADERR